MRPRGSGGWSSFRVPVDTVGRDSPLILAIRAPHSNHQGTDAKGQAR
jgi:hypothetical protein